MIDANVFKKKLIDDNNKAIKSWALENGIDVDRLRNILNGRVKPTEKETAMINNYAESEGSNE